MHDPGHGVVVLAKRLAQANHDVILAAVTSDGGALQFASVELQGNQEIVLAAVNQKALALLYAADALKADRNFVLEVVKRNALALSYVKKDPHIHSTHTPICPAWHKCCPRG